MYYKGLQREQLHFISEFRGNEMIQTHLKVLRLYVHKRYSFPFNYQTYTDYTNSTLTNPHKYIRTHSKVSKVIPITHLQVPVHHAHLMAVKHRLQDLLDAMTACKHQGRGAHVSLSSATIPCTGQGCGGEVWWRSGRGLCGTTGVIRALLLPHPHLFIGFVWPKDKHIPKIMPVKPIRLVATYVS